MAIPLPKLRSMLLNAKSSLIGTPMSHGPKLHQLLMHRSLEKTIWGAISEIPGEADFLDSMSQSIPSRAESEGKMPKV